jgi:hypothetical protein
MTLKHLVALTFNIIYHGYVWQNQARLKVYLPSLLNRNLHDHISAGFMLNKIDFTWVIENMHLW